MTANDSATYEWTVSGMDCASCAGKVRGAVERLPGVSDVDVALMTERLRLTLDEGQTPRNQIEAIVKRLGYGIAAKGSSPDRKGFVLPDDEQASRADGSRDAAGLEPNAGSTGPESGPGPGSRWYQTAKGRLVIGTGLLLAAAWAVKLLASQDVATWAFILATLIGVAPIARRAVASARAGMPFTIEMLMTIAASGALVIDAAEEAALVVFLFAVGEVLEGVAANKARDGIRALARLVPKTAILEIGGRTRVIPADQLQVDQIVLVRPGDRVPADGEVIEGTSGVDESAVTGESVPKLKEPGASVFAGSINSEAALRVRVTKSAEDNTIARIIRLVEEAESARAPTERFIDRFSRIYMPAVVGVAVLVAIVPPLAFGQGWDTWIYRALALLLIGCPCALVISVPASIASALSSGARRGLLMKGGAVIEAAAATTQVAFDKTGTLTHGRPRVTDVVPISGSETEVLALAAAVEAGSSHPLAEAILSRAEAAGAPFLAATAAKALPGKGAEAVVEGETAWVGSPRFAGERGVLDDHALRAVVGMEDEGKTVVAVFRRSQLVGLVALRDEPREDAARAVQQLKALGIASVMLTGDNRRTAAAISAGLGIDHRAELMPEGKVAAIREMTARDRVMMVGDGINDAPALATAHIGVAMGSGTDVALETADAAILRNRVLQVPNAPDHNDIGKALDTIFTQWPELPEDAVAHVFGEHSTQTFGRHSVPYISPERVQDSTWVRVLIAKDAISTGWDCPRAEVMVSFRPARDKTHITQLLGRMVRTPLARRIPGNDRLNSVDCLLPFFDEASVKDVAKALMSGGDGGDDLPGRRVLINPVELKPNPAIPEGVWDKLLALPSQTLPKRHARPVKRLTSLAHELAVDGLLPDAGKLAHSEMHKVLNGIRARYKTEIEAARKSVMTVEGKSLKADLKGGAMTFDDFLEEADYAVIEDAYRRAGRAISPDLATTYSDYLARNEGKTDDMETALMEAHVSIAALGLVPQVRETLEAEAEKLANQWLTRFRVEIKDLSDERQDVYRQIREMSANPMDVDLARPTSWMQATTIREANGTETPLPTFERHLLCDEQGLFPEDFNSWEGEVVRAELGRSGTVAWYRNPSRASQDSLGIIYDDGGEPKIVRPDFVFFGQQGDGTFTADIVDPHGIQFGDAIPKLKGLAQYAERFGDQYRRIDAVAKIGDTFRVLDLKEAATRAAVERHEYLQESGI